MRPEFLRLRPAGIFAGLVLCAFATRGFGYTQNGNNFATNGSFADVSAALGAAGDGAIVTVPPGEYTWGDSGGRLFLTKAITLAGAGSGGAGAANASTDTIIDLSPTGPGGQNALINLLAAATVKDLAIHGGTAAVPVFSTGGSNGWRITNITYVPYFPNGSSNPGVGTYFCLVNNTYGLIDDCNITGAGGTNELIFGRGPSDSWQTANSMGTVNNVFIESCTFNGNGYVCDANANARFVVRFCTINGRMKVDGHGVASNTPARSVRHMEVYDNTWTSATLAFPAVEIRGGTGFLFDNSVLHVTSGYAWFFLTDYGYTSVWPNFGVPLASTAIGNPAVLTTTVAHGLQSGWLVNVESPNSTPTLSHLTSLAATVVNSTVFTVPVEVDAPGTGGYVAMYQTPYNYPVKDQIGVGEDPKTAASEPLYLWDNKAAATNGDTTATVDWALTWKQIPAAAIAVYQSETGNSGATFAMSDVIKADRDYFKGTIGATFDGTSGVGVGTKAQMLALDMTHGKTGVGYWVTDEGSWDKQLPANTSGQLYVWNGTSWALTYTPFTFPHPLRAPTAPSNLTIKSP